MTTQYVMRAFKTTAPTGYVYWSVLNAPDMTGVQSGYNPASLTGITVDYSLQVPINGDGGIVPPGIAGGDLSGTYPNPQVAGLISQPLPSLADGYLNWNGSHWALSPISGGGAATTFVWQPGGTAGGNVYTTWSSLYSAITGIRGPVTIFVDDSISSPAAMPSGSYDLSQGVLFLGRDVDGSDIQFANGCTISMGVFSAQFINFTSVSSSNVFSSTANGATFYLTVCSFVSSGGSPAPMVDTSHFTAHNANFFCVSSVIGDGTHAVCNVGVSGDILDLTVTTGSIVESSAVTSVGGGLPYYFYDSSTTVASGLPGTHSPLSTAAATAYTPATSGNWDPVPSFVNTALDQISNSFVYNVKNFGAKGDGVTDDTAAIQSAITSANGLAAALFFPYGTYLVSQELTVGGGASGGVIIYGESHAYPTDVTTIKATSNNMRSIFNVKGGYNKIRSMKLNANGKALYAVYRQEDVFSHYDDILAENALLDGWHAVKNLDGYSLNLVPHAGNLSPLITVAGVPLTSRTIIVKIIDTGGALGTAQYEYSTDNGATYSAVFTTPTTGTVQIADTINSSGNLYLGLQITFPAGNYSINNYWTITASVTPSNNDTCTFNNCWGLQNGTVYATSNLISNYTLNNTTANAAGTISVSNGSQTITGSGTAFTRLNGTAGPIARVGDFLTIGGGGSIPRWSAKSWSANSYCIASGNKPGSAYIWKTAAGGTSTGAEPTWPTVGSVAGTNPIGMGVVDGGGVSWACVSNACFQIMCVNDDATITVGVRDCPAITLSGLDYAINIGHGFYEEPSANDNNLASISGGLWRGNAGAGISCQGLYGPGIGGGGRLQMDGNGVCGISIGTDDNAHTTADTVVSGLYSEGNLIAGVMCFSSNGLTIQSPITIDARTLPVILANPYSTGVQMTETSGWQPIGANAVVTTLGGDVVGTSNYNNEVTGLLSHPLPALASGNLNWNGSSWDFNTTIWNQSAWYVNGQTGNDSNTGTSSGSPLKTCREIIRRWGTSSPIISQNLVAVNITGNLDPSDAIEFYPSIQGAGGFRVQGTLTAVGGVPTSISSVTAQNLATGARLTVVTSAFDWTPYIGSLCHDTTANAWFWIVSAPSSGHFVASQPLQSAVPSAAADNPFPSFVTIAGSDSFVVYTMPTAQLTRFGCTMGVASSTTVQQSMAHLNIIDSGSGPIGGQIFDQAVVAECYFQATTNWHGLGGDVFATNNFITTGTNGSGSGEMTPVGVTWIGGCLLNENINDYGNCLYDGNIYIDGKMIIVGQSAWSYVSSNRANQSFPCVSDVGSGFSLLSIKDGSYGSATIWGTHILIAQANGTISLEPSALSTWTNALKNTGGLKIGGGTTAYAWNSSTQAYTTGITLTPANLDLAIGSSGFGGSAHLPNLNAHFIQSDPAQS